MTSAGLAASAATGSVARARPLGRLASTDSLVWIALALVWILAHSYVGIEHDARIYMGRALADLDPAGVGRDMMFQLDGQSAFSLYRFATKALVARLGLEPAVVVLTLVNLVVWFGAIVVFVRTLVPGRAALLVLAVAIVLPRFYSPWHLLQAGESVPVPRPLAEACILLAMAALCRGRTRLACVGLVVAALLHPIIAAPGFAMLLACLVHRDRRWLAAPALAAVAVFLAAAGGVPFVSRLLTVIDPQWRAIAMERCAFLWVHLWPADTFGPLAVQAATIALACLLLDRTPRFLLASALLTGLLGLLASLALADALSSLLALQAQLWRALWLPAVLAPVAAGICAWRLPSRGRVGLVALSLMALAWGAIDWMPLGPLAAAAALGCLALDRYRPALFSRRAVVGVALFCGIVIVLIAAVPVSALAEILAARPAGASIPWSLIGSSGVLAVPVVMLAGLWWRWQRTAAARLGAALAVAGLAGLVAVGWDSRSSSQAAGSGGLHIETLRAMVAPRQGEVLWVRDDRTWVWLGRPAWASHTQGAAIVFSRELALRWHDRAHALIAHGFADASLLSPWRRDPSTRKADLTKADFAGLCRRADAPAWIVLPIEADRNIPNSPGIGVWSPGFVDRELTTDSGGFIWTSYDRYGLVPCAQS